MTQRLGLPPRPKRRLRPHVEHHEKLHRASGLLAVPQSKIKRHVVRALAALFDPCLFTGARGGVKGASINSHSTEPSAARSRRVPAIVPNTPAVSSSALPSTSPESLQVRMTAEDPGLIKGKATPDQSERLQIHYDLEDLPAGLEPLQVHITAEDLGLVEGEGASGQSTRLQVHITAEDLGLAEDEGVSDQPQRLRVDMTAEDFGLTEDVSSSNQPARLQFQWVDGDEPQPFVFHFSPPPSVPDVEDLSSGGGHGMTFRVARQAPEVDELLQNYEHQDQGATVRCGDFAIVNALNFLGRNHTDASVDDIRRVVMGRAARFITMDEMLTCEQVHGYLHGTGVFGNVWIRSEVELIPRVSGDFFNHDPSLTICTHGGGPEGGRRHFTALVHRNQRYFILDSMSRRTPIREVDRELAATWIRNGMSASGAQIVVAF